MLLLFMLLLFSQWKLLWLVPVPRLITLPKTSHLPFSYSEQQVSIVSTQQVNSVTEMGHIHHRQADGALPEAQEYTFVFFCLFFSEIMHIWSDSDFAQPAALSKCWHSFLQPLVFWLAFYFSILSVIFLINSYSCFRSQEKSVG